MSDTISNPNPSHWNALRKIVKRLPANLAYYGSALGAIVLAGGGQLPPGLEFVAGSIGGNMLSNMISDILKDEDLLDDEIRQRAEEAIHKSDIANLLTKLDFLQGYARLIQRLDAQKTISQDILDELQTGFSKVATADQVDELKHLILQLMQQPLQTAARKVRLFISYARKDDEPFVEHLYHDLKDKFDVWWDRETMSNRGKTFLQEIRDAIDRSDRLLLVAGPGAFTSDYVRDEWQYAYETYKGINIALRLGDYANFPAQLSGFDAPDFRSNADYDERLKTLKRQLAEPVAPIGTFHNVPALPPHFLNRLDVLDALRDLVIADVDKPTLISAEKRTTAVEGMGGIGKSVLAAAFAHDRKVRFAFPDGIVWLTVGRDAKLYELYRAVGVALGDDLSNYPDETTARQNVQKALASKKCLLILDDVWELSVGRAFRDLISGTVTRLLITTRNLQINDLLNANEYRLKLIDKSQAGDYLRSWAGEDPNLDEIAEKLGYLFLALKVAGARMKKDNLNGANYLRTFDRVSRMKIDRNATDRDDSLEVSITLSVNAAFAGIDDDRLLYHTLGIFQEDTAIPQQTILQLWRYLRPDADEFGLLETFNVLVDLALVERLGDRTITLHDLLHSYTREKLGSVYVETHRDLLASYQVKRWHELSPDELYLWQNIAYHLTEAQMHDVLANLLLDYYWLQAKLDVTDIGALLADCQSLLSDTDVHLIHSALSLSEQVLEDKAALPGQLAGRLIAHRNRLKINHLVIQASEVARFTPLNAALMQGGNPLLRTLTGHTDFIWGAIELSDGRLLSWSSDETLRLWSSDGTLLSVLNGHVSGVGGAIELSDKRLLSWSPWGDDALRLWTSDGIPLAVLVGHTVCVSEAIELSDGRLLSFSRGDCTLRLWTTDGTLLSVMEGHSHISGAIELLDKRLLSWSSVWNDTTLRLWSSDGISLGSQRGPTGLEVIELSDGRLATWGMENTIQLRSHDGMPLSVLEGHTGNVDGVLELSDGKLLSWAKDHTLRLWMSDGAPLAILEGHVWGVRGAIELSNRRLLSWAWRDKTLRLWASDGTILKVLEGHTSEISGAIELSDGSLVSWTHYDHTLRLWASNGTPLSVLEGHTKDVDGVLELSNGHLLSWGKGDSGLYRHTICKHFYQS